MVNVDLRPIFVSFFGSLQTAAVWLKRNMASVRRRSVLEASLPIFGSKLNPKRGIK